MHRSMYGKAREVSQALRNVQSRAIQARASKPCRACRPSIHHRQEPPPPPQVWMRLDVSGLHPKPSPARASAPRHGKGVFSTCPISASFDLPPDSLLHYTSTCINLLIESTDWTPRGCIHHAAAAPTPTSLCCVRCPCRLHYPPAYHPARPPTTSLLRIVSLLGLHRPAAPRI